MNLQNYQRSFLALSCVLSLSLLGACQALENFEDSLSSLNDGLGEYAEKTESKGPDLPPASLPEFGIGDAFVYDSGRTIYVANVTDDRIVWNGGGDYIFEMTRDFTGPILDWSYTDEEDQKRSGTGLVKAGSEDIWPLEYGKHVRVSTRSANIDPVTGDVNEYDQWLTCTVPETATVTVAAGTFDTYVIKCSRYYRQWWMQTTKWWYAPEIGFYVKRDRSWNSGQDHSEELLTFGPAPAKIPQAQQDILASTVQTALENNTSGDAETARLGSLEIAVTPLQTVQTDKGVWCRTYRQELTARDRTSQQVKSACRTNDGWILEDDVSEPTRR